MQTVLSKLHNRTDKVSVGTKQILLSAMSIVDHDGNITNTNTIKCIHPKIHCDALKQIAINKHNFNTTNTNFLYNNKTCGDERTRQVFHGSIDNDIIKYWVTNTTPDPNTRIGRKLRNAEGQK